MLLFSLKELGELDYFLGLEVKYLPDSSLIMTQTKYIRDLLSKTHMIEAHPISSPMVSNCKVSKHGADLFSDPTLYRSVGGALQYVTLTRLEISFSVNKYLKGTIFHELHFQVASPHCSFSLKAYCDADWASDVDDRRSTSKAAIFLGPNLISWGPRKQQIYRSLAQTSAELSWISALLTELHVQISTPVLLGAGKYMIGAGKCRRGRGIGEKEKRTERSGNRTVEAGN
ncbi:hypothetical protein V8G54_032489 [Vigna mungo]|uniref:Reverse transcriptase Ty1/copia-type domain-containing protein n=1 Tax=Vigna mungo TaxID=3915 RepID=A0AAQ3RGQ7_VIGMU